MRNPDIFPTLEHFRLFLERNQPFLEHFPRVCVRVCSLFIIISAKSGRCGLYRSRYFLRNWLQIVEHFHKIQDFDIEFAICRVQIIILISYSRK